jgi:hypothetical protein
VRITFTILAITSLISSYAADIVWHRGSLVLANREVRTGRLALHAEYDLVLMKNGSQVIVYPAHKLSALYFYDSAANINRKFQVIQAGEHISQKRLFEIVVSGKAKILRHARANTARSEDHVADYHYFVSTDEELMPISKFRENLFEKFVSLKPELAQFVNVKKLNPNNTKDVFEIVMFYNQDITHTTSSSLSN